MIINSDKNDWSDLVIVLMPAILYVDINLTEICGLK